jgi:Family of unknown function (DUF6122)
MQFVLHYSLHLLAPAIIAYIFFKQYWLRAYLLMLATLLIDLDHLFARPVYDACRCSIGFHPLHGITAAIIYALLFFVPNKYVKVIAIGCLFHLLTDALDCYLQVC